MSSIFHLFGHKYLILYPNRYYIAIPGFILELITS